jgi:hypothetical protein
MFRRKMLKKGVAYRNLQAEGPDPPKGNPGAFDYHETFTSRAP